MGGITKRIGATGTPVMNRPNDMVGLARAINADTEYQNIAHWSKDPQNKTIEVATVRTFCSARHMHVVKDTVLNLPKLTETYHDFKPELDTAAAVTYNSYLGKAQALRMHMERANGKGVAKDMQQLMLYLQKMQQLLVSPRLGERGAAQFDANDVHRAGCEENTGALRALRDRILALQADGHSRIIVACNHVIMLKIAAAYLTHDSARRDAAEQVGTTYLYDGSLSLSQRTKMRLDFLSDAKSVLLLSIGAGGTGVHMVPQKGTEKSGYCRAIVFWGSRPFSPMQVRQTFKRIHRIGQEYEVEVHHLISKGSVDDAINFIHKDKEALSNAIVNGDDRAIELDGGEWRKTGRVVDKCFSLSDDGAEFVEKAPFVPKRGKQKQVHRPTLAGTSSSDARSFGQWPHTKISMPSSTATSAFFKTAKRTAEAWYGHTINAKRARKLALPVCGEAPF